MALLIRTFAVLLLTAGLAASGYADEGFLEVFDFSGFVQGRGTGLLFNTDTPRGPLNSKSNPALAGGEASTRALLKRLEFTLQGALPWEHWFVRTSAGITGAQTVFKDLYLSGRLLPGWTLKAGQFRVPFGLDPQISSGAMDTVERPLIYGFGNFGWVAPLGLEVVGERDLGLRLDWASPPGFANFAPFVQTAVVCGNGHDVAFRSPTQAMARLGIANRIDFEELKNEVTFGASFSYGANRFVRRTEHYLPIGVSGDLETDPGAAVAAEDLGDHGVVMVEGFDLLLRMNNVVFKTEAVSRQIGERDSQGYYVTGILELGDFGVPVDLVARWEEAVCGYADGAHLPNTWYQAATAGVTWHPHRAWRVQANYIALLLQDAQHVFPGSDLLILQVQWSF